MSGTDLALRESLLAAGLANQHRGRFAEAEQCYRVLLTRNPRDPEGLYRMGVLALQCANAAAAVHYLKGAAQVRAPDADGWYNLGMAYVLEYRFAEARGAFELALECDPGHPSAAIGLGNVYKFLGKPDTSAKAYLAAVASPRIGPALFSQVLVSLHTNSTIGTDVLFELHREWARRFAAPLYPASAAFANERSPHRRLAIGFVSPSFNAAIVGHFLRAVLPSLAHRADVFLYDAGADRDWLTDELRGSAKAWRDIAQRPDEEAAAQIRGDRIDVLFDLAGHVPGHRLTLFARRAAPVQITWLDYFDTSGLATMDVIVSDPVSTPEGDGPGHQRFVERVARMPHARLCYAIPPYAPAVAPARCSTSGEVTFGCFGRADKVDPDVVALWSEVLRAVPTSRLLLKSGAFDVEPVRARVLQGFAGHGVDPARIVLRGASTHEAMLGEYADVDVALDTFPYNGGATTCDALAMGVPVVTLAGSTMIARQGAALLAAAGCDEWIARDTAEYVRIAADLAHDVARLAALRGGLRGRLRASALCDGDAFARDLYAIAAEAWHRWCADGTPRVVEGGPACAA